MTRAALFTKHRPLARSIARGYYLPGGAEDDLEQEALIALWLAAGLYDGTAPFPQWAGLLIRRRLITVVQGANRRKHRLLHDALRVTVDDDGEQVRIVETLPGGRDPLEVVVARETIARVVAALGTLTARERAGYEAIMHGLPYSRTKRLANGVDAARRRLKRAAS